MGRLPLHEYLICRKYVLEQQEAMQGQAKEDPMASESWGESDVADAHWDTEAVKSLK